MLPCVQTRDDLGETIRAMGPFVRSVLRAHNIPSTDAADLLQDIFLVYVVKHEEVEAVKPWLAAVARRRCLQFWGRRRRSREIGLAELSPETPAPATDQNGMNSRLDLARAMEDPTPRARELVSLRYWEGCDKREVADRSGLAEASIDKTTRRILGRIRRRLGPGYPR
jgi:RNA polymerase sigma factor (sigma-70 family)